LIAAAVLTAASFASAVPHNAERAVLADGGNPDPVTLVRPATQPLSAMARLGRDVFFDPSLSSSGRLSCASCHSAQRAYGPPDDGAVMLGGPHLTRQGLRAVPSLMYLERQPAFSIGPDDAESENTAPPAPAGATTPQPKTAHDPAQSAQNLVPQGGLFWDGRADTLQDQALGPLLDPREIDGGSVARVAAKLRRAPYAAQLRQLAGPGIFDRPRMAVAEALFAVARYQIEDASFHPYSSKYDRWLEGRARFTPAEARGYARFNDPAGANCAACHLDRPTADGLPPLFTDNQFEALGVPRNTALAVNRAPAYVDLGLCGPVRTDLKQQTRYCGMFRTPTLRNVATRRAFFHNGVYDTLQQVLDFYNFRDTRPQRVYPRRRDGSVATFDDLPASDRGNVDTIDAPFDRPAGSRPPLSAQQERDIIAFLHTLTDGYRARVNSERVRVYARVHRG
jgi:cytochrome c peroxidase